MTPLLQPSSPLCCETSFLTSHHHQGHTVLEDASCTMPRNVLCTLNRGDGRMLRARWPGGAWLVLDRKSVGVSWQSTHSGNDHLRAGEPLSQWIRHIRTYPHYTCTRGASQRHHRTGHCSLMVVTVRWGASSSSPFSIVVLEERHPKRLAASGRRSSLRLPPTRTRAGRRAAPPVRGRGRVPAPCR